jgi:hypothetical protein
MRRSSIVIVLPFVLAALAVLVVGPLAIGLAISNLAWTSNRLS